MKQSFSAYVCALVVFAAAAFLSGCASSEKMRQAVGWTELGNAWAELERWDKAGAAWSRAMALDPGQGVASYNLTRSLAEAGKYDEALAKCDEFLRADPSNAAVLSIKAYTLHKAGRSDDAIAAYEKAAELNAGDTGSIYNLAVLLEAAGKPDEALERYNAVLAVKPDDPPAAYRKGLLLASKENFAEAIPLLELYVKSETTGTKGLFVLAYTQEKAKLYLDAMKTYKAIVDRDAKNAEAWFELARLRLVIAGDKKEGLAAVQSALENGFSDEKKAEALLYALTGTLAEELQALFKKGNLMREPEAPARTNEVLPGVQTDRPSMIP